MNNKLGCSHTLALNCFKTHPIQYSMCVEAEILSWHSMEVKIKTLKKQDRKNNDTFVLCILVLEMNPANKQMNHRTNQSRALTQGRDDYTLDK